MDYTAVSTILRFGACEIQSCVDIHILDDTNDELDEALGITLERTPDLNGRITLETVDGVVTITDEGRVAVVRIVFLLLHLPIDIQYVCVPNAITVFCITNICAYCLWVKVNF